jgi:hypothetical protein
VVWFSSSRSEKLARYRGMADIERAASAGALRNIPGIGDKKLEHYGEDLLALVAAARPSG